MVGREPSGVGTAEGTGPAGGGVTGTHRLSWLPILSTVTLGAILALQRCSTVRGGPGLAGLTPKPADPPILRLLPTPPVPTPTRHAECRQSRPPSSPTLPG